MSCSGARVATNDSKVKVEENRRIAIFKNEKRSQFFKTKVDGGMVTGKLGADYVVTKHQVGSVVVELKGVDVEHAVDQIRATVDLVRQCPSPKGAATVSVARLPMAGLIVCSKYPSSDSMFQKRVKRFVRDYGIPLHCVSGKGEFDLERVLQFNGPK